MAVEFPEIRSVGFLNSQIEHEKPTFSFVNDGKERG
jgi:hypothetical protein